MCSGGCICLVMKPAPLHLQALGAKHPEPNKKRSQNWKNPYKKRRQNQEHQEKTTQNQRSLIQKTSQNPKNTEKMAPKNSRKPNEKKGDFCFLVFICIMN